MTLIHMEPAKPPARKSKAGRKTDLERARIKHEIELEVKALQQERKRIEEEEIAASKRAKPIDPLRTAVLIGALFLALIILTTSAVFSFATVAAVAEWMVPEWDWLVWVVPGFIEAFIIFFGIDSIVSQAKGKRRDAITALVWMLVFSAVAVVGNAAHTIDGWGGELTDWRAWVGTGFSAIAPLSVVLITKRVSKLVFAESEH